MPPTPVLDQVSANIAYRLGDPRDLDGTLITSNNLADGKVYSELDRELYITQGLRKLLSHVGHRTLRDYGYFKNYIEREQITFVAPDFEATLPVNASRVLYIDYYGKKILPATWEYLTRQHNMLAVNSPLYEAYKDGADMKVRLFIPRTLDTPLWVYYFREVPLLEHEGDEDIMIPDSLLPTLEQFAEIIGRRFHQELHPHLVREAASDVEAHKENSNAS